MVKGARQIDNRASPPSSPPLMANLETLMKKCTSLPQIKQLLSHLLTTGNFQSSSFPRSKLLEFCCLSPSAGDLSFAAVILSQINYPSTNDYNSLIRGHARSPNPTAAILSYRYLMSLRPYFLKPDALTCSFALQACARALAVVEAKQIHAHTFRFGYISDLLLRTTLLDVYAKVGDLDSACLLSDEMPVKDVAMWNALIAGLAQGNRPTDAICLFNKMKLEQQVSNCSNSVKPNEVTVLGVLSACSQLGALNEGEKVYGYIRDESLDLNVQVCNAVIDMYSKCGFVDKAYSVFENMICKKTVITWNTMIMAFAMQGDGYKAIELFEEMGRVGMRRDAVSYLAVLCACNHGGLVEEGERLFDSMVGCGVKRDVKHYGIMVDLLGRAGRIEEAYKTIKSMPMLADTVFWQTLLGASKTYGNVNMAEIASKNLAELGSSSCGDFVLLSNVYAASERWCDVERVRDAMKSSDVRKIPGFSYIEIEGLRHKFFNGDQNHPNGCEIYAKLDEIRFKMNAYGYIAKTNLVLHDIGEEDKENALNFHSEKLAVAFGLISTSEGSPILVYKNLRICADCHIVIKLISKIYNREVIVRDRARFHRFIDGTCSCRDFW